jgi:hypothetical protein
MVKAVFHGVRFRVLFSILAFPAILAILASVDPRTAIPDLRLLRSSRVSKDVALLRVSVVKTLPRAV